MTTWQCMPNCGACCYLEPSNRPDLADYLTPEQMQTYLSLVGADGWCINFNHTSRQCQVYSARPDFCRVSPTNFEQMFGINSQDFHEFAVACCQEHIGDLYGVEKLWEYDQLVQI